jgi:hypothetical protein
MPSSTGLWRQTRGIEQEGILAQQATGWPVEFEQQIDERIVDRPRRTQADHRLAVGAFVDGPA